MAKKKAFPEKTCCIINPYAANQKWKRSALLREYFKRIFPVPIIDDQKDKSQTIRVAKELSRSYNVIVAAGGDGTISDVIQGIIDSGRGEKVILGIIPFGSGNAFLSSLGLPRSIALGAHYIRRGKTRTIDLIDIEGKIAAFASIGATAQITVEKYRRSLPGFLGHAFAAWNVFRMPRKKMKIDLFDGIDDKGRTFKHKTMTLRVFDCVIGKTKHFGYGWRIAPKAEMDDGFIDITLFETSPLRYVVFFLPIYLGLFQWTQKHFKAKRIILEGDRLPIQYHGEILGIKDRIELKILPKALRIITP